MKRIVVLLLTLCSTAYAFPVSGTVHSTTGSPIAGAAVTLHLFKPLPSGKTGALPALPPRHTVTDVQGRFAFSDVPSTVVAGSVSAEANSFAPTFTDFDPLPNSGNFFPRRDDDENEDTPRTATIILTPETRLPVRVVDSAGHGIAGMQLYPQQWRDSFSWTLTATQRDFFARQCPPTDAEGTTTVFHLPQGGEVRLLMRDDRWAHLPGESGKYYPLDKVPVSALQTVTVQPAASLSGHLTTESGHALSNTAFQLWASDKRGNDSGRNWIKTDRHGAFEARGLEAGIYRLNISVNPGPDYVTTRTQTVTLTPGEQQTGFHAVCQKGSLLTGRVVSMLTGKPIAGALLDQAFGDILEIGAAKTDRHGIFHLRVEPGRHFFTVGVPPGFRFPYRWKPSYTLPTTFVNDTDYDIGNIQLALERSPPKVQAALHGKVVDSAGQPVVHATVFYMYTGWKPHPGEPGGFGGATGYRFRFQAPAFGLLRPFFRQGFGTGSPPQRSLVPPPAVLTDGDGNFTISNLGPRNSYTLSARRGNWGTMGNMEISFTGKDGATPDPALPILRMFYLPMAMARGRVVNQDGSPAAHIPIDISFQTSNARTLPHTDAHGFFQCAVPPIGTYFFYAESADSKSAVSFPVHPHPGQWLLLPPMTLANNVPESDRYGSMTTRIMDEKGQPAPSAQVTATVPQDIPPYETQVRSETDEKGFFSLDVLPPGQYILHVISADGLRTAEATLITAGGATQAITPVKLH